MTENTTKPLIYKRVTKNTPNGHILEDKQLTVQGDSLKEVEKVFDRKWKES